MKIANLTYRYIGKELEDRIEGFHFYDYGARFYDAALARWHSVDPMAEEYISLNPYNYVGNNPINTIDPNGMFSFTVSGHRGTDTDQQILYGQIYSRGSTTYINNGRAPTYFIEGNRFKPDPGLVSLV